MKKSVRKNIYISVLVLLALGLGLFSRTYAISLSSSFSSLLEKRNISVDDLLMQEKVTRYRVTELLSLIDCHDCHKPSQQVTQVLSSSWWDTFRLFPGKNFDDVGYSTNPSGMYYCVANTANNGYMNGYPRTTSPFCSGKFCGDLFITHADFLQTLFNIAGKTFYGQYTANWTQIKQRLQQQPASTQARFDLYDQGIIMRGAQTCQTGECVLQSTDELDVYATYCTFVSDQNVGCHISPIAFTQHGQRPVAQVHMLVQQGILSSDDLETVNIEDYAPGSFILSLLGRVKERMQCIDDDDQDDDGITDYDDNCYLTYNPTQRDTDADTIGDVCDTDIDGDSVYNPLGAVDDNGNINTIAFTNNPQEQRDNCLFDQNTNQQDDDTNGIGNICDVTLHVGIRIQPKPLTTDRFMFVAQYSGSLHNFVRYFGDQNTGSGEWTTHTYSEPGQYTVRVEATTVQNTQVTAFTTVTVAGPRATLLPEKLVQHVGERVSYTIQLQNIDNARIRYAEVFWGDGRSRIVHAQQGMQFYDAYTHQGGYPIYGVVYTIDGKSLPIGAYVTVLGGDFCLPYNSGYREGHCDMDEDALPDVCDADIDGDGFPNMLDLIIFEQPGCIYDAQNTQRHQEITGGVYDSCPFSYNTVSATCTPFTPESDIDEDGILDAVDACPLLPETVNGQSDEDGCPEYNQHFTFPGSFLQPGLCTSCPCQYAQNDSMLLPGDRVKALLYTSGTNTYITESAWYTVQ